ncbi:hypothetical protein F53441_7409 [Fusarium austroafricanum]|uniref:Uncharacterized protein n=1 Tax=Fusarium austroafricanum TaxID=2364996 RepID=A0A8H4KGD0_9HYPO|nr:hypothetical protein F53441_7409 [Fusarium austroafricanum]
MPSSSYTTPSAKFTFAIHPSAPSVVQYLGSPPDAPPTFSFTTPPNESDIALYQGFPNPNSIVGTVSLTESTFKHRGNPGTLDRVSMGESCDVSCPLGSFKWAADMGGDGHYCWTLKNKSGEKFAKLGGGKKSDRLAMGDKKLEFYFTGNDALVELAVLTALMIASGVKSKTSKKDSAKGVVTALHLLSTIMGGP